MRRGRRERWPVIPRRWPNWTIATGCCGDASADTKNDEAPPRGWQAGHSIPDGRGTFAGVHRNAEGDHEWLTRGLTSLSRRLRETPRGYDSAGRRSSIQSK
jgi:hypothetical protein